MAIGIIQPYFFPYIGYFQLINACDKFILFDDVSYIKKGWINRNHFLINKQKKLFTLPLKKVSQNKLINTIEIFDSNKSINLFLKMLYLNYKKAPYFNQVNDLLTEIFNTNAKKLSILLEHSIKCLVNYMEIDTKIIPTSSIYNNSKLKGTTRIIDICKKENADLYINPISGKELYSKETFQNTGLELKFIKPTFDEYKQFDNQFHNGLSIIDVLMFNPKQQVSKYLNNYQLI